MREDQESYTGEDPKYSCHLSAFSTSKTGISGTFVQLFSFLLVFCLPVLFQRLMNHGSSSTTYQFSPYSHPTRVTEYGYVRST